MGSLSKYYDLEVFKFPEYSSAKKKLNEVHCKALVDARKNILTHICPGYTDTPMIKDFSVPKMNVEVVADAVEYCIKMGQLGIEIADLTLCQIKDFGEPPRERQ
jgi:NAD(P)-dependent dehydrogenase (short-subunit alcohol dehydrogenase family)